MTAWLTILVASALAVDVDFYLESASFEDRAVAEELASLGAEAECPGRVVRRFVRGEGWRFLYRTEPAADEQAQRRCLEVVDWPAAAGLRMLRAELGRVTLVDEPSGSEVPVVDAAGELAVPPGTSARDVLRKVALAHGGPHDATSGVAGADETVFRFRRTTPDGRRIDHLLARRGEDLYLEVRVVDGEGTDSRAGVVDGRPWVVPPPDEALDAAYVRAQIERFSPERVLGLPMRFIDGVPELRELESMRLGERVLDDDGVAVQTLVFDGDREAPPLRLGVRTDTWRIAWLDVGDGPTARRWRFGGYRELDDGVLHPGWVRVWVDGAVADELEVQELDLAPTLLDEWFSAPAASTRR